MTRARLSVGLVSPLPSVRSGIADYAKELVVPLREHVDLTTFAPAQAARAVESSCDVLLFQVGNDPLHLPSVEALRERRKPAVVVLHDFVLHHLFAAGYLDHGHLDRYERELVRCHGLDGGELAAKARSGAAVPVWDPEDAPSVPGEPDESPPDSPEPSSLSRSGHCGHAETTRRSRNA